MSSSCEVITTIALVLITFIGAGLLHTLTTIASTLRNSEVYFLDFLDDMMYLLEAESPALTPCDTTVLSSETTESQPSYKRCRFHLDTDGEWTPRSPAAPPSSPLPEVEVFPMEDVYYTPSSSSDGQRAPRCMARESLFMRRGVMGPQSIRQPASNPMPVVASRRGLLRYKRSPLFVPERIRADKLCYYEDGEDEEEQEEEENSCAGRIRFVVERQNNMF